MSIKPVQIVTTENKQQATKNNVSFGSGNVIIATMDAIDRGGFAASFITQDFLGMAAPRVGTGVMRNYDKTGKLNTDFAKKEGIREVLSGPSAFLIPAGMLAVIKKISGEANNVPIDFINGIGENFKTYAQANKSVLTDATATKQGFYEEVFKNLLSTSTDNKLAGNELTEKAKEFAKRTIEIEKAPKKSFFKQLLGKQVTGSAQDLKQELLEEFINVKKQYLGAPKDKIVVEFAKGEKTLSTSFKTFLNHIKDYSNDAIKTTGKKLVKTPDMDLEKFITKFNQRRSGTRFLSNMGMVSAVIIFYTIIPKLYNMVTKGRDPGLDGLVKYDANQGSDPSFTQNPQKDETSAQPSFTGLPDTMAKFGKKVSNSGGLFKKFSNIFEFDGASMSVPAMVSVLFGFCLPPRLINAQSSTDRKEILFRDITSFSAILFGAKALTKGFSTLFSKISGLALNIDLGNGKKSIGKTIWNYINPTGGIAVLDNDRILANYSNVDKFKNGITDMFRFVDKHGGNVGKMLNIDKDIQEAATTILGEVPNKNMKLKDIITKFDAQKGSEAYKKIVDILSKTDNTLVKKAKTYNSAFGFASTIVLIPALMIWISKYCERMTKKRIEAQQQADEFKRRALDRTITNTPTMEGFLKL